MWPVGQDMAMREGATPSRSELELRESGSRLRSTWMALLERLAAERIASQRALRIEDEPSL
jgi:hypothetical protein